MKLLRMFATGGIAGLVVLLAQLAVSYQMEARAHGYVLVSAASAWRRLPSAAMAAITPIREPVEERASPAPKITRRAPAASAHNWTWTPGTRGLAPRIQP